MLSDWQMHSVWQMPPVWQMHPVWQNLLFINIVVCHLVLSCKGDIRIVCAGNHANPSMKIIQN
jgi:hypothetical protein